MNEKLKGSSAYQRRHRLTHRLPSAAKWQNLIEHLRHLIDVEVVGSGLYQGDILSNPMSVDRRPKWSPVGFSDLILR